MLLNERASSLSSSGAARMPCSHENSQKTGRKTAADKQQLLVNFCLSVPKIEFKNFVFFIVLKPSFF